MAHGERQPPLLRYNCRMQYLYETADRDYATFAGGQVFQAYPGHAAFPARLASEIFQRCAAQLAAKQIAAPYTLYDPVCGAAAHLATIAFLNWDAVAAIIASDVDHMALEFAAKNLSLLSAAGLQRRIAQLAAWVDEFGKESHRQSLHNARRLQTLLGARPIATHLFRAGATRPLPLARRAAPSPIDIVFADIPYGARSQWRLTSPPATDADPVRDVLDNLQHILPAHGIVAIAGPNRQKINHPGFQRLQQLRAGKRRITLLSPVAGTPARQRT